MRESYQERDKGTSERTFRNEERDQGEGRKEDSTLIDNPIPA